VPQTYRQRKDDLERRLIADALAAHPRVEDAAAALGVRPDTLYRRIRTLGIPREDHRGKKRYEQSDSEPTNN